MLKLNSKADLQGQLIPGVTIFWRPIRFDDFDAARETEEATTISQERWALIGDGKSATDPETQSEIVKLGVRLDRAINQRILAAVITNWDGVIGDDDAVLELTPENVQALLSRPRFYNRLVALIIEESDVKKAELEKNV